MEKVLDGGPTLINLLLSNAQNQAISNQFVDLLQGCHLQSSRARRLGGIRVARSLVEKLAGLT
jgi:hypothetical protein